MHQIIGIHSADRPFIVLDYFPTKISHLQWTTLEITMMFWKKWPSCLRVKITARVQLHRHGWHTKPVLWQPLPTLGRRKHCRRYIGNTLYTIDANWTGHHINHCITGQVWPVTCKLWRQTVTYVTALTVDLFEFTNNDIIIWSLVNFDGLFWGYCRHTYK